jgi:hypothetical protein
VSSVTHRFHEHGMKQGLLFMGLHVLGHGHHATKGSSSSTRSSRNHAADRLPMLRVDAIVEPSDVVKPGCLALA